MNITSFWPNFSAMRYVFGDPDKRASLSTKVRMNLNHADGLRVLRLAQTRIVKATNRTTPVYTSKALFKTALSV